MKTTKKGEKNLKFKDGKWYLDFTFDGKRYREFAGYTKTQAKNTLTKRRTERLNDKLGFTKSLKKPDVPFGKFADEFLELYSKQNKRSWRRDRSSLKNLKPFFKDQLLQGIGPEDIERYKAKRGAEVSAATINREVSFLKTLFNKAVEWGRLEMSPALKVKKLREPNYKERILTQDEAGILLDMASPQVKPVLVLALNTGMRRGEILGLRWENIDFHKGFIFIEDSKNGRSRNVPMNGLVFGTLKKLPRRSEFVFFNAETRSHIKDVKTAFKGACRRSKIKGLRFHDLRHTSASWMVEGGVDLVTVSKILGHSSIQMTMRYAHPTPENMKLAVEKLGEILDSKRKKTDTVEIQKSIDYFIKAH